MSVIVADIRQLSGSPRHFSDWSVATHSPGPDHGCLDQHLDRLFREPDVGDLGSTGCLGIHRCITTSHGPHPSRMAVLVHGIHCTGR